MSDEPWREQRFHEARCLAAAGRSDEAHPLLLECVVGNPASADFAAEYLANLDRRTAPASTTALKDDEAALKRALGAKDWPAVLELGPRLLAHSSKRLPLLLALAAACEGRGFTAAQEVYLRAASALAADNAEIQRQAAKVFASRGHFDEAIAAWQKVAAITGECSETGRAIAELTIAKCRRAAGPALAEMGIFDSDRSREQPRHEPVKRFIITHPEALGPASPSSGGVERTPIQQLEAAIRERPSIPDLYLRLAQLYLDKDRDYDAERVLRKGRDATDNDARVVQMWEEVALVRHHERVRLAKMEAEKHASPQSHEALAQAEKERSRAELEVYHSRVRRDPQDAASQLELGRALARAEKLREAMPHLEHALADPCTGSAAALELGRCHERLGDVPAALKHYRLAADSARSDHDGAAIDALLAAAKLALKIKLSRLAERYLGRLLRLDPDHREAAVLKQCL